jgi:hypothetical protein
MTQKAFKYTKWLLMTVSIALSVLLVLFLDLNAGEQMSAFF